MPNMFFYEQYFRFISRICIFVKHSAVVFNITTLFKYEYNLTIR